VRCRVSRDVTLGHIWSIITRVSFLVIGAIAVIAAPSKVFIQLFIALGLVVPLGFFRTIPLVALALRLLFTSGSFTAHWVFIWTDNYSSHISYSLLPNRRRTGGISDGCRVVLLGAAGSAWRSVAKVPTAALIATPGKVFIEKRIFISSHVVEGLFRATIIIARTDCLLFTSSSHDGIYARVSYSF
jgi:hypothetical protein